MQTRFYAGSAVCTIKVHWHSNENRRTIRFYFEIHFARRNNNDAVEKINNISIKSHTYLFRKILIVHDCSRVHAQLNRKIFVNYEFYKIRNKFRTT